MRPKVILMLATMQLILLGCGGGGGLIRFDSFSALKAGDTTRMTGLGLVTEYDTDPGTGAIVAGDPEAVTPTIELDLDGGGALTAASLTLPPPPGWGSPTTFMFDTNDGDVFYDGDTVNPITADYQIAESAAGDEFAAVADPVAAGFEYQSFGIWATGIDVGAGVAGPGVAGAASAGAPTEGARIPNGGMAHYDGMSAGFYIDPDGAAFLAFADFDADVDFGGNRSIDVFTSETSVIAPFTGIVTAMPGLDFIGLDGAVAGDGGIAVPIAAAGLAGNLDGQLYGPNAEELGGVFAMEGDAGRYFGAVGAAQ